MIGSQPAPSTLDWGLTAYEVGRLRQEDLVARRISGEIPDTLVFTEHTPVFTLGVRPGAERNLVWDPLAAREHGVDIVRTNRGGDVTYHGPGQIVGYPIVSLFGRQDLHAYLRFLEEVLLRSLAQLGLTAARAPGKTGIWIETRKVAALGVAVRRWVAYHGFALNVNPDLGHFQGIVPCGIAPQDGTVTSLQAELGRPLDIEEVKGIVAKQFWVLLPGFLAGEP